MDTGPFPWATSLLLAAARTLDMAPKNVLHVLLYHRIANRGPGFRGDPHVLSATPEAFDAQMRYITRYYVPVTAEQAAAALCGEAGLPRRAVLVTFDDAYADFLIDAWPVLQRWRVPVLLFIPTAFPGTGRGFWWDELYELIAGAEAPAVQAFGLSPLSLRSASERWAAVRRLNAYLKPQATDVVTARVQELREILGGTAPQTPQTLTWEDLRTLTAQGLAVGSHTRTHPAMPSLSPGRLADEVSGAHQDIRRELGCAPRLFSYPFGMPDARAVSLLRELGYAGAFVSLLGRNLVGRGDPYHAYRHAVDSYQSPLNVGLSLITVYVGARESGRAVRSRLRDRPAGVPA